MALRGRAAAVVGAVAAALGCYLVLPLHWPYDLPTSARVAEDGAVVHAAGESLYVAGAVHRIRPAPDSMAVTEGGLYYLADEVLYLWDRDGSTRIADLGADQWLQATADGRYLAFIDREHGPLNLVRQRIAQTVVVDTATGEEVVRDVAGNGARMATDDLADLYSESPPTMLGFGAGSAYAATALGNVYRWDLATGERTDLGEDRIPRTPDNAGGAEVAFDLVAGVPQRNAPIMGGAYSGRLSPDGSRLAYADRAGAPTMFTPGAEPVTFPVEEGTQFLLAGWLSDAEFLGVSLRTPSRPGAEVRDGVAQVTVCAVGTTTCRDTGEPVPVVDGILPVLPLGQPAP